MAALSERRAIERTYTDTCDIYSFNKIKTGSVTQNEKILLHENIKCAVSQKSSKPTGQTDSANIVSYDAKLFIAPGILIEPGCIIEVTRFGHLLKYESTGEPFFYETHQEIMLKRNDKA